MARCTQHTVSQMYMREIYQYIYRTLHNTDMVLVCHVCAVILRCVNHVLQRPAVLWNQFASSE